jgi:N-methylhydantoinase A
MTPEVTHSDVQIGVEIGGTFTDLVLEDAGGRLHAVKVPSTPAAPEQGALEAVRKAWPDLGSVRTIIHGSTIATNGVLERRGARVGLLVTRGFRDLLDLQRQDRTNLYQLKYAKPEPLVRPEDVRELTERIRADGEILRGLVADDARSAARELIDSGVKSLAVCLLHAYRYPQHELLVRQVVEREWPGFPLSLSHEIAPEYREYERCSTTVLSSYVMPIIDAYLHRFESELEKRGFRGDLHVMQSNGGALPATLIRRHAIRTLLSGPAGGVTAAKSVARTRGIGEVITFDMGGTSTDVCLIQNGEADIAPQSEVDNLPIRVPMLDIISVGAGGGSIASVDKGGMLRVGPQSAGATPGPACYGRGGAEATVTDANVVLGLVRPDHFLGGRMKLDKHAAVEACARLGKAIGMDAVGAARAIVEVVNTSMEGALRLVSTERGADPRRFWLLCYGGAGGQHAAALADELSLRGVIVPRYPGLFSAYGLLIADLHRDWSAPFLRSLKTYSAAEVAETIEGLKARARQEFAAVGQDVERVRYDISLDMRYPGQAFELEIGLPEEEIDDWRSIGERFNLVHRQRYGHAAEHETAELVTVRVTATIPRPEGASRQVHRTSPSATEQLELNVDGENRVVTFVQRDSLDLEDRVDGPSVIEEETSTIWVPAGWHAALDEGGHLRLERSA